MTASLRQAEPPRRGGDLEQDGAQPPQVVLRDERSSSCLQSGELQGRTW